MFNKEEFLQDRREMLLALDVAKMRAYMEKYGEPAPDSDEVCMIAMHKARIEAGDIPFNEKMKSRFWLQQRGYKPGIV